MSITSLSALKRQMAQRRRNLKDPKWGDNRGFPEHGETMATGAYLKLYHGINCGRRHGADFVFVNVNGDPFK